MWATRTDTTWSKLYTGFILNPKPDRIIICGGVGVGVLGLNHFPESRSIWCMLVEHPARFGWEMIRGWEDRERKRAGAGGRGGRKEARTLIAPPGTGIIYCTRFILYNVLQGSLVYWEVYLSTRLSLTPAGMWKYVWSRLNFIYAEIGTLEPSCRLAELFWRVKMSPAGQNLKEQQNLCRTEAWKTLTIFVWCIYSKSWSEGFSAIIKSTVLHFYKHFKACWLALVLDKCSRHLKAQWRRA